MPSLNEIRTRGLNALRRELGQGGMIRFMAQFETGSGDYAQERHAWVDRFTEADLRTKLHALRAKERPRGSPGPESRPRNCGREGRRHG